MGKVERIRSCIWCGPMDTVQYLVLVVYVSKESLPHKGGLLNVQCFNTVRNMYTNRAYSRTLAEVHECIQSMEYCNDIKSQGTWTLIKHNGPHINNPFGLMTI